MKKAKMRWVKALKNDRKKTIRLTKQQFATKTEGEKTIGGNYIILAKEKIKDFEADGYTIIKSEPSTSKVTEEPWTPQYIVGDPEIEEQIRAYVEQKKRKQAVAFVKKIDVPQESWKLSTIDNAKKLRENEQKNQKSMQSSYESALNKYYKRQG